MMSSIIDFISENYKWIFSGIGVVLMMGVIKLLFFKPQKTVTNIIGNNSKGTQAGRDVNDSKEKGKS